MQPELIGKRIKEIYPQYAEVPDAQLGARFMLKHGEEGLASLGFSGVQSKETSQAEAALRQEFRQETGDLSFKDIRASYDRVKSVEATPAGDLSLIFSYMKLLDPQSVVREGEQATAENARGVPESIRNTYNKVVEGRKLTDEQRADFKTQGALLYNQYAERQKELTDHYTDLAKQQGLSPENVVGAVGDIETVDVEEIRKEAPQANESDSLGENITGATKALGDFLFGSTVDFGQDVVQGLRTRRELGDLEEKQSQAEDLFNQAEQESDPVRKQQLTDEANRILQDVSATSQSLAGGFSESIDKSPLQRGAEVGLELGTVLEAPAIIRGGSKLLRGGASTAGKVIRPGRAVKEAADAETAIAQMTGSPISLKAVKEAGEEYIRHDPAATKLFEKVAPSLDEAVNAQDALKKLRVFNKAYTGAGKVGKSSKAGLYDTLSKALREEIGSTAPDVAQAHGALRDAVRREKFVKGVASPFNIGRGIVTGAATSAGLAALRKLGLY